jgi:hypothetical protein
MPTTPHRVTGSEPRPAPAEPRARRWPYVGHGQQTLAWASVLVLLGAFLPWVMTGVGTFTGMRGAGTWTVFAGAIGLGAALMRHRRVVLVHAVAIAVVAIALPVWQVVHLLRLVGLQGWLPGIGLIMTLAGGIVIARAAVEIRDHA